MGSITMIIDLQYGSTGKGALAGKLSMTNEYDTVVSCNMPNAGHTAFDCNNIKYVHKILPSGIFSSRIKRVMIGPGSVFDPILLEQEVQHAVDSGYLKSASILVHGMSVPLTEEMKKKEENSPVTKIASTAQGSMVAQIEKMERDITKKVVARDTYIPSQHLPIRVISNSEWIETVTKKARHILAETSQGYSLGISQDFYPYCTSRDCTPARFLSDLALPHKNLVRVIGLLRTFPIRVGNTDKGESGDCYYDQEETTWNELGFEPEITTITGRIRRVFTFSEKQLHEALIMTGCDELFINFLNYIPCHGDIQLEFLEKISKISEMYNARISYVGIGPFPGDILEVRPSPVAWIFRH